jgi:hypothetical protein
VRLAIEAPPSLHVRRAAAEPQAAPAANGEPDGNDRLTAAI